jgi:hypothetical protein
VLGARHDVSGCDHGSDLDARVHLGAPTAGGAAAARLSSALLAARFTPRPAVAAATTAVGATTAGRLLGLGHGRQANGCPTIGPARFGRSEDEMALRVVGAGVGRTGTASLQLALQQLLGGRCYHMGETFGRPEDFPVWQAAATGIMPDWHAFLAEYVATVDWPACAFWRELADANPDAIVLLSTRASADAWWKSAHDTIFQVHKREIPPEQADLMRAQLAMVDALFANTFTPDWEDEIPAKRAYEAHNAAVRAGTEPARLVEWQPGDGWEPLCAALGVPVPDDPFPHVNSTADFRAMIGMETE